MSTWRVVVTPGKALGDTMPIHAYAWLLFNRGSNMQAARHIDDAEDFDEFDTTVPLYGTKPERPGLYLGLFHGRHHPRQRMNGWGFDGPTIGPLRWCHTTYAHDIKIEFEDEADAVEYFGIAQNQFEMTMDGDLLIFGGKYFGDWTVYYVKPEDCERPVDAFRDTKRVNNLLAHRKYLILASRS